jgi:DNA primase
LSAVAGAAARFFVCLAERSWVPDYLAGRGFGPEIWRWWGVGYAPAAWTGLTDHLRDLGFADRAIRAAGLARRSARGPLIDMFRNRVMFPVHSPDGAVAGFIGRARPGASASVPVYLNTPTTRLYRKSSLLFGRYQGQSALAAGAVAVITEGPLDAIAVTAAAPARYAGMALCGAALTRGHVRLLAGARLLAGSGLDGSGLDGCGLVGSGRVVVAFDADPAGRRAAVRAFPLLRDVADDIWTVSFPAGLDPASYFRAHGGAALARLLDHQTRPLADLVIDETVAEFDRWAGFTDGKFLALRAVAPVIADLPPGQVARQVARVADRLNLTYAEVTEAVTTALSASP